MKKIIINKESLFLFLILLLASVLRFYNAFEIPFTHDEFSALFRTDFDTFSDLITRGVMIDGHPAGVQVYYYYWTQFFGTNEFALKFPFILMGIGSVYLIWKIACLWYNSSVAFLSALFLATLAYPIMYSQIARPYISGLFLTFWMVYHWSLYLFNSKSKFNKHLVYFIIASTLCAYNHHFTLLFAAIVGLSGIFFIDRKRILFYVASGLGIFILYIPHLPIFFYQLKIGGIGGSEGWLGSPKSDFLWNYIRYSFNFSWLITGIVLAIVIIAWYFKKEELKRKRKFFYLSLAWFLIPFLVAYFYSINVNPVLQYSVLLFSFPFLFFILFGHVPPIDDKWKMFILAILSPILLYSLVVDREYYSLFYNSIYENGIQQTHDFQQREKHFQPFSIVDFPPKIADFYKQKYPDQFSYYFPDHFQSKAEWITFIKESEAGKCSFTFEAISDPMLPAILIDHFPVLTKKLNFNQGNYYEFSKVGVPAFSMYRKEIIQDFEAESGSWKMNQADIFISDSISYNKAIQFKEGQEWGLSLELPFDSLYAKENDLIDIRLDVLSSSPEDQLLIVSEFIFENEKFDWRSSLNKDFYPGKEKLYRMYHCIKLADLNLKKNHLKLKVYLWNKGKTRIVLDNFSIKVREGNPIFYGLIKEFNKEQ